MAGFGTRAGALAAGGVAGLVAAVVAVVPALGVGGETRLAEYAALLVVIVGTHAGIRFTVRERPTAGFADRLAATTLAGSSASLLLGLALWRLYSAWRPGILAARYAALVDAAAHDRAPAARLADLTLRKAQYLDPLFQALSVAVLAFFFALLTGGYAAFRWRVAARVAAARRGVPR